MSVRGARRAPAAKKSRGVAVATPASSRSTVWTVLTVPIVSPVVTPTTTSWITAIGVSHSDSSVRPLTASTDGPICFFTRP